MREEESGEVAVTYLALSTTRTVGRSYLRPGWFLLVFGAAALCVLLALRLPDSSWAVPLLAFGTSGATAAVTFWGVLWFRAYRRAWTLSYVAGMMEYDAAACFVTDPLGQVLYVNGAGRDRYEISARRGLGAVMKDVFADPSAVLGRLQKGAENTVAAVEDIVTRRGHLRIHVHRLNGEGYLWRVEEIGSGPARRVGGTGLPMLTVGRGNVVLFMNDAARDFCGQRLRSLEAIFPELPICNDRFNQVFSRQGVQNCLVHLADSSPGRREIYFFPLNPDGPQGVVATDLETLPVALLKLNVDGQIRGANRAARRLLNMSAGAFGHLSQRLDGPGRPIPDWLAQAARETRKPRSEFLPLKGSDQEAVVQVTLAPAQADADCDLIAVLNDATELKSLEAQFVQSQKMQAIGELAGGVAHDFNNLLTAISGHCDLLLLRHDRDDPDFADLDQVSQNANRAAALVGQLLAFSRKQTLRPEVIDIRNALADLTHLLDRLVGEKVSLQMQTENQPWAIHADKRQLEQVLMNLVVNARDAMNGGGLIRIETHNKTLQNPLTRDRVEVPPGDYLQIDVIDNGCGIPAELCEKIFEPFFTTKRSSEGTGLGLSTAYGIVKQSGGFIFVDSQIEVGTCFSLLFPACDAPMADLPPPPPPLPRPAMGTEDGVVLLVEDEAPVRAFAARALRLSGFTVIEAESAEEALEILEDPKLEVDVFLTDVIMPGRDGPSWVSEALKTRPQARVIFVSGYAEDAFDVPLPALEGSRFLPKPFSLVQLTETVRQQFH